MAGMTNNTETPDNESASGTGQVAGSATADKSSKPSKRGNGLGMLALLVSLIALAASGALYLQSQNDKAPANTGQQTQLQRSLAKTDGKAAYNAEAIERLNGRVEALSSELQIVPDQIARIEKILNELPQVDTEAAGLFLELEADWYLRLADSQLSVAGNNNAAREALLLADERLEALANPRYVPVRNRIAAAAAELELQPDNNTASNMTLVQAMLADIDNWPLRPVAPENFHGEASESDGEAGWDRALGAMKQAFSSVIEVRQTDERAVPQINNADINLLYRSLELDLQMTRLALLQNDAQLVNNSLDALELRLNTWFDTDAEQVQQALANIATLRGAGSVPLPDLAAIRSAFDQLQANDQ